MTSRWLAEEARPAYMGAGIVTEKGKPRSGPNTTLWFAHVAYVQHFWTICATFSSLYIICFLCSVSVRLTRLICLMCAFCIHTYFWGYFLLIENALWVICCKFFSHRYQWNISSNKSQLMTSWTKSNSFLSIYIKKSFQEIWSKGENVKLLNYFLLQSILDMHTKQT